jgi:hypothetical protein
VRRDHVPEEDVSDEPEACEDALHDGGRRLRRTVPRQLTLGRERKAGDACASVSGSFADEQRLRPRASLQVRDESRSQKRSARPFGVLVEGRSDACGSELVDDGPRSYDARSVGELGAAGLRGRTEAPPTRRT